MRKAPFYWFARPGTTLRTREYDAALLGGEMVVYPATGVEPPDRILVIDVLIERLMMDSSLQVAGDMLAIYGRPWPRTERLQYTVGDSIRWRVINTNGIVVSTSGRIDGGVLESTVIQTAISQRASIKHRGSNGPGIVRAVPIGDHSRHDQVPLTSPRMAKVG